MCFHIHSLIGSKPKSYVEDLFDASFSTDDTPNDHHANGFDCPELLIITQEEPLKLQKARWSILPPNCWSAKDYRRKKGGSALNTRDDSFFSNKIATWKSEAVLYQKCLVLVTGFFEPHRVGKVSYPYLLHRSEFQLFGLAGIYTKQQDGLLTFSIITTRANKFLEKVHNGAKRMPISLLPEEKMKLLARTSEESLTQLFDEQQSVPLQAMPVHRDILNAQKDTNSEEFLTNIFHPIFTDF